MVKNVTSIVTKKPLFSGFSTSREIRTLVLTLKGLRPGPLDDGGSKYVILFDHFSVIQHLQRDSNSRFNLERVASWSPRRWRHKT